MKKKSYELYESDNRPETAKFYQQLETDYKALLNELMQRDCQRVEFIRGMLFILSETLYNKSHWKIERQDPFKIVDYK